MATTAEIERVEAKIIAQKGAKSCDKYDYLTAVGCGVVAGLVDSFFVAQISEEAMTALSLVYPVELCENLWMDTSCRKRKQCFECDWFSGKKLPSEL